MVEVLERGVHWLEILLGNAPLVTFNPVRVRFFNNLHRKARAGVNRNEDNQIEAQIPVPWHTFRKAFLMPSSYRGFPRGIANGNPVRFPMLVDARHPFVRRHLLHVLILPSTTEMLNRARPLLSRERNFAKQNSLLIQSPEIRSPRTAQFALDRLPAALK